jgi:signal transduction histidine kinase
MSVAAQAGSASSPKPHHLNLNILFGVGSALWLGTLALLARREQSQIANDLPELGFWLLLVGCVYLAPLRSRNAEVFVPDFPVMTAVALIFSPVEAALVSFATSFQPSEFRRDTNLLKATFNHSQISAEWFIGSLAAHALYPVPSPALVPLGLLALLISIGLNYVVVGIMLALQLGYSIRAAMARLRIGSMTDFGLALLAGGSIGAMLAAVYQNTGLWILPVFLGPLLLTRQALFSSQMLLELDLAYKDRETALVRMADQIDRERADERRLIAADLHDEVLQPLFSVSLLGQTLRNDLATGRLLELEEDLPKLVSATDRASEVIRTLVGDLRKSGLGRGGLASALHRLSAVVQEQTRARVHSEIDDVQTPPKVQLALYQIAKEGLGNVVRHSRANNAWLELSSEGEMVTLSIRDDGIGFDPTAPHEEHYGLLIMKERAVSVGGSLYLDSAPGEGCQLRVIVQIG